MRSALSAIAIAAAAISGAARLVWMMEAAAHRNLVKSMIHLSNVMHKHGRMPRGS
jgi:hypothetical protein